MIEKSENQSLAEKTQALMEKINGWKLSWDTQEKINILKQKTQNLNSIQKNELANEAEDILIQNLADEVLNKKEILQKDPEIFKFLDLIEDLDWKEFISEIDIIFTRVLKNQNIDFKAVKNHYLEKYQKSF